jgi:hypothetical protein
MNVASSLFPITSLDDRKIFDPCSCGRRAKLVVGDASQNASVNLLFCVAVLRNEPRLLRFRGWWSTEQPHKVVDPLSVTERHDLLQPIEIQRRDSFRVKW